MVGPATLLLLETVQNTCSPMAKTHWPTTKQLSQEEEGHGEGHRHYHGRIVMVQEEAGCDLTRLAPRFRAVRWEPDPMLQQNATPPPQKAVHEMMMTMADSMQTVYVIRLVDCLLIQQPTRVAYRFVTSLKKMAEDKGLLFLLTFINDDTCEAPALKRLMEYAPRITIETTWQNDKFVASTPRHARNWQEAEEAARCAASSLRRKRGLRKGDKLKSSQLSFDIAVASAVILAAQEEELDITTTQSSDL